MAHKETDDINVAAEWIEQDKARVDKKKATKKREEENRCEESIWEHRQTISKGSTRRYRNKYDSIDWGK